VSLFHLASGGNLSKTQVKIMKEGKKNQLIHDLQSFLWQFEQGGYTRDSMHAVLAKLEKVLENDGESLGEPIKRHVEQMIRDCRAYAFGAGNPQKVVGDLDKLRQDLER